MSVRWRVLAAALVLVAVGCSDDDSADDASRTEAPPPAGPEVDDGPSSDLDEASQRPSVLVARPAPVSVLGDGAVAMSDLERAEILRDTLGAEQLGEDTLVSLPGDVLFDFDDDAVTAASRAALADLAELIEIEAPSSVTVAGHTDSIGAAAYNQDLSERRAAAVAEVLVTELGVDRSLLDVQGFGDTDPVARNEVDGRDDPEGRARNRRVDVTLHG